LTHPFPDPEEKKGGVILVNRFRSNPRVVMLAAPNSAAAEEYRKVVVGSSATKPVRGTLAVLSPLEGEGKTLTSVNLALALAERHPRKVLLVDFDLRRPSIEGFLADRSRPGLAELLRGSERLSDVLQNCPREHLSVLSAGRRPETAVRLLDSGRIAVLLATMVERFDVVVADCPPLLPFAESRSVAAAVNWAVLVARAEVTPRSALQEALELISPDRLIGVLLNAMPSHRWERYGYRYAYRWRKQQDP
jgi:capsular exopolysaccharide synthesis family protein